MKRIPLTPYPGTLLLAESLSEFKHEFKRRTGGEADVEVGTVGRTQELVAHNGARAYLVFATGVPTLVHELSHVVLNLFEYINVDPRDGRGEPFCYLLDHLVGQALKK